MVATLTFRDVRRVFSTAAGATQALGGISLRIEPGSFTAIVGPSGCGKSTLLNIAAGLDTQFDGHFERTPPGATTAFLFQSPRLLPWRTAHGNVSFVLEARGMDRRVARGRATEMLRLVGLTDAADRFPSQLSGGMQQRVALARALAVDPDMLLMDEPFASLDELTARRLRAELLDIYVSAPRTIVFVTHNIHEACYLADRVVVMCAQPGVIVSEVDVGLERPRSFEDPRLSTVAASVLQYIESSVQVGSGDGQRLPRGGGGG